MKHLLILTVFLSGCANMFSASTKITYTGTDGKQVMYESYKVYEGLDVSFEEVAGKPTAVKIHIDKATTAEEAIKAAIQANMGLQDLIKQLVAAGMGPK